MRRTPLSALLLCAALVPLTACNDDEDPTPPSGGAESATTATPSESPSPKAKQSRSPKPKPSPSFDARMTVRGDDVEPVAQRVDAEVGEPVVLAVDSDRTGELHVHSSPEQYLDFKAGTSTLRFTVERPGTVDVEEHDSGQLVLRVLVQ